jgi:hypothetical protein
MYKLYCVDCKEWVMPIIIKDFDPPDEYTYSNICSECSGYNLIAEEDYDERTSEEEFKELIYLNKQK